MRKLASVQKIKEILPIQGADLIELAIVNGWKVVVAKNVGHKVGDLVVYCEIDSFLPIKPEFEFLRKSSYKKMGDLEGFRLKTIKLRGTISQGLILPLGDLQLPNKDLLSEGMEVTKELGIVKYEPPVPAELAGKVKGIFPGFLVKTDEERIQNLVSEYDDFKKSENEFYSSEKLDGTSATYYLNDGIFGVCSRNLELLESEGNSFWKVAREIDLENKMRSLGYNVSLQGELVGEGIQKNPYRIKGQKVFFFNLFDIDKYEKLGLKELQETLKHLNLESVPILEENYKLPDTVEDLLLYADNKSLLNPNFDREGVVIRSKDGKISFKAISNKFLLNEE
jgi:RNA ligase (TIGR02306 family)